MNRDRDAMDDYIMKTLQAEYGERVERLAALAANRPWSCVNAAWLWSCDVCDSHGVEDSEEQARLMGRAHRRVTRRIIGGSDDCEIVVTWVDRRCRP